MRQLSRRARFGVLAIFVTGMLAVAPFAYAQWRQLLRGDGMQLNATTFANLGTPSSGTVYYCSDCTIANPCAGSGTGAFAKRLNSVWVCN